MSETTPAGKAPTPRNPVVTGWLVAIAGLMIAAILGFLLMWIGSNRLETAKKTEQPYRVAFSYIAQDAIDAVNQAEASIKSNNWGQAQGQLDAAGNAVTAMEQAASKVDTDRVHRVRILLGDVQTAVGNQDSSAAGKAADMSKQLQAFIVQPQTS